MDSENSDFASLAPACWPTEKNEVFDSSRAHIGLSEYSDFVLTRIGQSEKSDFPPVYRETPKAPEIFHAYRDRQKRKFFPRAYRGVRKVRFCPSWLSWFLMVPDCLTPRSLRLVSLPSGKKKDRGLSMASAIRKALYYKVYKDYK